MCKKNKRKQKINLQKNDLQQRLKFFQTLKKIPQKDRCALIPYLSNNCTDLLCEAIYNTINVDYGLRGKKKQKLVAELKKCGKHHLNHICKKSISIEKRKQLLSQKGGFLGVLLSAVIPTIASLIQNFTSKNNNNE